MGRTDQARLHAIVTGRVQGVGFRYFVLDVARELGLSGAVRNLRGGQVEVVAEGKRTELERLAAALREGPPAARVTNLQLSWAEPTGRFTGFSIQASG
ncbi:MAG: acylphosphatase [Armatimonadetes bacterium]|nr:acylphosphatase [Armatimonadota bacterium]